MCLAAVTGCLVAPAVAAAAPVPTSFPSAQASPTSPPAAPRDPSYSLAAQRQASRFATTDASFDQDRLVTDVNYTAVDSLTSAALQQFLAKQTGILAAFHAPDHLGVKRSAVAIILQAARAWQVSPKVLLATLQKEQSLLTRHQAQQHGPGLGHGLRRARHGPAADQVPGLRQADLVRRRVAARARAELDPRHHQEVLATAR